MFRIGLDFLPVYIKKLGQGSNLVISPKSCILLLTLFLGMEELNVWG